MRESRPRALTRRLEAAWATAAVSGIAIAVLVPACGRSESPSGKQGDSGGTGAAVSTGAPSGAAMHAGGAGVAEGGTDAPAAPAAPGWLSVAWSPGTDKVKLHANRAAFALDQDQTLYPGLAASGLSATYNAVLTPEKGKYRFSTSAAGGRSKLTIYSGATSDLLAEAQSTGNLAQTGWLTLDGKPITLNVSYERAGAAKAQLQTFWEREGASAFGGFAREPIPSSAVVAPAYAARDLEAARGAFHGRLLLGELNCIACHSAGAEGSAAASAVTPRQAPNLGEIGRRASPEWLAEWVLNPQEIKPGSGMPDVLGDSPKDRADAEAITHFLVSLGGPVEWEPAATEARVLAMGSRLYHSVGCVSCHGGMEAADQVFGDATMNPGMPETPPPQPYGKLAGKWRPAALAEFLKDPLRTHPGGRMPSMSLNDSEADLIATYLVNAWGQSMASGGSGFAVDPAKAEAGRAAFGARGCAECHAIGHGLPDVASTMEARPLAELKGGAGCLVAGDAATPRYTLSDQDRIDLALGIEVIRKLGAAKSAAPAPIDEGHRIVGAMGCLACHETESGGGVPEDYKLYFRTVDETELGDEGRLPPRLTGVGFKLHSSWIKRVLTEGGRSRPYMAARMPQFGEAQVGRLDGMLAMMDGVLPGTDLREPAANDDMILAGRSLAGEKGLNCISCHTHGGKTTGTPGPELTSMAERIRYEWWKPYMMEPTRFKPGTRMTAFYREGKGSVTGVFGGDPHRQTDALWAYLNTGMFGPAPEGLPTGAGLPVEIGERPVVFRSFLKDVGSRGIAVGHPIGVHFGFSAEQCRLVNAWQGSFVDATSAWKGRGGMVASGQGKVSWKAPKGPPLVVGAERPEQWPTEMGRGAGYRFGGYRLDAAGAPVFLYRAGEVSVEERITPMMGAGGARLERAFTLSGVPGGAAVWVAIGADEAVGKGVANVKAIEKLGEGEGAVLAVTPVDASKPVSFTVTITPR